MATKGVGAFRSDSQDQVFQLQLTDANDFITDTGNPQNLRRDGGPSLLYRLTARNLKEKIEELIKAIFGHLTPAWVPPGQSQYYAGIGGRARGLPNPHNTGPVGGRNVPGSFGHGAQLGFSGGGMKGGGGPGTGPGYGLSGGGRRCLAAEETTRAKTTLAAVMAVAATSRAAVDQILAQVLEAEEKKEAVERKTSRP